MEYDMKRACLSPGRADVRAEQIQKATHDCVAVRSVEIQKAVEQITEVKIDGKPMSATQTPRQTSVIEIDTGSKLVRIATRDQMGTELVAPRKGKRPAMLQAFRSFR
jgi:hypothetical protein